MEQVASVPPGVAATAAARGLGEHQQTRTGNNPVAVCLAWLLVGGVLFGVAAGLAWLAETTGVRAIAIGVVLAVLAGAFVVAYGFYELFQGFRVTYLFRDGLVWTRNGRVSAAHWTALDELVLNGSGGKLTEARITTVDGRRHLVRLDPGDGGDPVHERLVEVFGELGRPLGPRGVSTGQPTTTGLADSTLQRIVAFTGIIGGLVLGFVLDEVVGWPLGVALLVGYGLVALACVGLGLLVDRRLIGSGKIFGGLVGIIALVAANHVVEGHYVLVTGATLAIEAAIVAAAVAVYRSLPAPRRFGARRRLAAKRGWRYLPDAAVPVGGPKTATRLLGVPTRVSGTTGDGVVTATVNGFPCIAYDRARRRPRLSDPVQTVWTVFLPAEVPADAMRALASPRMSRSVTTSWIEGPYLYGVRNSPASPAVLAEGIEELTRRAAYLRST